MNNTELLEQIYQELSQHCYTINQSDPFVYFKSIKEIFKKYAYEIEKEDTCKKNT